ncbi:YjbF family lipoprotein [Paracoccus zhejiangensis]|nr:YjbF family lipoprotein [Paracoccus zhejiangensis]
MTMTRAIGLSMLALLAACGNDTAEPNATPLGLAGQAAQQIMAERKAASEPKAPARTQEQIAAEALRVNPGPLIMAGLETAGRTQVMAMTGQNGAMRTYMTPNEQALILRSGMLVGTRGLGNDMSVTEASTEGLIRAGRAGNGQRVIRYYAGDGLERPLTFNCTVGAGPNPGVMVENCEGLGISFQNSFMVQGGQIPVSRQWAGPRLGYVTIQTLRP